MKTSSIAVALLSIGLVLLRAQTKDQTDLSVPASTDCRVVDNGANHRIWQWETYEKGPKGQIFPHVHKFTELAAGLNYQDATGQWVESKELIEAYSEGAIARQGQHQVIFANNLNSYGSIDMQTPDGKRLRSNILGLMYVDNATGDAVLIAEIKDTAGQLAADNQVLYPDAFDGVRADVQYTYRRGGFEQDVILREQLPTPEVFGLDSATTELEVFTEFINPPSVSMADSGADGQALENDQNISWGAVSLGKGKAFNISGQDSVSVTKRYVTIQGRHFLLEKVPVRVIEKSLSKLPEQASNQRRLPYLASKNLILPRVRMAAGESRPMMKLAKATPPTQGYVLDYVTINASYTNYTFIGGQTYYISGSVNLYGTNTFEGCAMIKYAANASLNFVASPYTPLVVFKSGPYMPVVFTSKDDNTIGENIGGSSGNPSGYYANPALSLPALGVQQFGGIKIAYAATGISSPGTSLTISNAQFVKCGSGIALSGGTLNLNNALFWNLNTNFSLTGVGAVVNASQVTFNNAQVLASPAGSYPAGSSVQLTNCVLVNVTNVTGTVNAGYNGFYRTPMIGSSAVTNTFNPMQQVGAANCYLTNGCSFFAVGTSNLDASLLGLLKIRTTHPPIVYSNFSISMTTNYSPIVQRDTNSSPDLGYHYEALDYVFGGIDLYSNMTFNAGTAIGYFELTGSGGPGYGISMFDKVVVKLNGTAGQRCVVTRYNSVQEGGNGVWKEKGWLSPITAQSLSGGYEMNPDDAAQVWPTYTLHTFTEGSGCAYREYNALIKVIANNSEFWSGGVGAYWDYPMFTNCLFVRTGYGVIGSNWAMHSARNCTMIGGSITLQKYDQTWPCWFEGCVFDGTTISVDDNSDGDTNITYCDFNSFVTNNDRLPIHGTYDLVVTNYNWQSSWRGNYYLPTNSPLVNAGSLPADQFGFYHFTTQTNQVKETNSTVDIGYHYVATDGSGSLIDSNGNGTPDYLEDANGNGLVDGGETSWLALPVITVQPTNQSVALNGNTTFSVTAAGLMLSYQWYSNSVSIPSATNTTLPIISAQINSAGSYYVVVTNTTGSTTSSIALLTVVVPPTIVTQPQPSTQTTAQGTSAGFTVVAAGGMLSYQWYYNGSTALTGATNSTLILTNVQVANAGNYSVIASNLAGTVTSSNATLTVSLPPLNWLQQYFGLNYPNNTNAAATADPDGDGTNNLQEYYNGSNPTDYYNGNLPSLTVISGDGQAGQLGAFLSQPIKLQVTRSGGALTNAPVTFYVTNTSGQLVISTNNLLSTSISTLTDTGGYASVWWFLPSDSPVTNSMFVTAQSGTNIVQITVKSYGNRVATPTITPSGGTYAITANVSITCSTIGAVIHYTLNGVDPTESDPIATNGQLIAVQGAAVVKAVAFEDSVLEPSQVQAAVFNITGAIAAGNFHTLVLKYDGSVWAAGTNINGRLGDGTTITRVTLVSVKNLTNTTMAIEAGAGHSLALESDGTVRAWGKNNNGQLGVGNTVDQYTNVTVINLSNVVAIAAGGSNSLALLSDGTVRAWGDNSKGELGDNTTTDRSANVTVTNLAGVVAIVAGEYHCLALQSNGTVRAWGANGNGQLGDTTITSPRTINVGVSNLTSVTAISAGGLHSLALLSNGTVRAWGDNSNGQIGDGTTTDRLTNVVVTGLSNVVAIAGGDFHSLSLQSNGTVRAWGDNSSGELGDGTTTDRRTNVVVVGLSNIVSIAAGKGYSLALKSDGTIWIWGYTNYGFQGGFSSIPVVVQPTNHLIYLASPQIVTQPQSQTNSLGQDVIFGVTAMGTMPMNYQWCSNSITLAGFTNPTCYFNNIQTNLAANYSVIISNSVGSVTSAVASLTVLMPISQTLIIAQPTNQTVMAGSSAMFSVVVSGTSPFNYQWYALKSGLISGATNTSLALSNVQTNNTDLYYVTVGNNYGQAASSIAAALMVIDPATDADGNGLPDWWELKYFGHTGINPTADPDGDGYSNLQEYLSGMDPIIISQPFGVIVTIPASSSNIP